MDRKKNRQPSNLDQSEFFRRYVQVGLKQRITKDQIDLMALRNAARMGRSFKEKEICEDDRNYD